MWKKLPGPVSGTESTFVYGGSQAPRWFEKVEIYLRRQYRDSKVIPRRENRVQKSAKKCQKTPLFFRVGFRKVRFFWFPRLVFAPEHFLVGKTENQMWKFSLFFDSKSSPSPRNWTNVKKTESLQTFFRNPGSVFRFFSRFFREKKNPFGPIRGLWADRVFSRGEWDFRAGQKNPEFSVEISRIFPNFRKSLKSWKKKTTRAGRKTFFLDDSLEMTFGFFKILKNDEGGPGKKTINIPPPQSSRSNGSKKVEIFAAKKRKKRKIFINFLKK